MVSRAYLVNEYGRRVYERSATLFIGAGLSAGAGYPSWNELLEPIRVEADVPANHTDAPLVAEYISAELGRTHFEDMLLSQLKKSEPQLTSTFQKILELDIADYWTTNYDNLLELAAGWAIQRVTADSDYATVRRRSGKRITKMHGSLQRPPESGWETRPVITRSDFERYEVTHPLLWAQVRAQFLTSSFLFLGFSFADPNIEVLLRLSRSLEPGIVRHPHFAVLRRPAESAETRDFVLRVRDLEESGIQVLTINDFDELPGIVDDLRRRSRPPALFLSGSGLEPGTNQIALCEVIGARLAELPAVALVSLAGQTAIAICAEFGAVLKPAEYDPDRIRFYYRERPGEPAPSLPVRMGTSVFTNMSMEHLREKIIDGARAMLVTGGGGRTSEEVKLARAVGVPVIPVAATGGTAYATWSSHDIRSAGLEGYASSEDWNRLASSDVNIVSRAVADISRAVMALE